MSTFNDRGFIFEPVRKKKKKEEQKKKKKKRRTREQKEEAKKQKIGADRPSDQDGGSENEQVTRL